MTPSTTRARNFRQQWRREECDVDGHEVTPQVAKREIGFASDSLLALDPRVGVKTQLGQTLAEVADAMNAWSPIEELASKMGEGSSNRNREREHMRLVWTAASTHM